MIALIAAYTKKNRIIGNGGRIPWNLPEDRRRFQTLTDGGAVIMGRRTYEEIGRPLRDRLTVVLSSRKTYSGEACRTARSLEQALEIARGEGFDRIFIAGGQRVYERALPLADILYCTEIDADFDGDTFFPEFDANRFIKTEETRVNGSVPFTFLTYAKA